MVIIMTMLIMMMIVMMFISPIIITLFHGRGRLTDRQLF